ncbi:MAG TPA: hydrolase [Nitrospiria bacterium]|jgi:predicted alpha/beta-fold hydrolase|nr:hydrolase [Nitrospiria bacterium]
MENSSFKPAWWCRGSHLQTVWRRLFGPTPAVATRHERLETPDDDFIDLDWLMPGPDHRPLDGPIVLVLHGLEGSSLSKYVLGLLSELSRIHWQAVAMNFRSCSGEINRQKHFYHSGETTDLDWVVGQLTQRFPAHPIYVVGFSLGGNVLLKWLGEEGEKVPDSVRGAVAVSVPFDLEVAARRIDRGINRIYGANFLKTMKEKALEKTARYPGLFDPKAITRVRSFAAFDDLVTAPLHGFRDGLDYWLSSSSAQFLGEIRRPTLLISAEDDPFLPGKYLPKKIVADSKWLESDFPAHGGHVGFVQGPMPWAASYWIDQRIVRFLKKQEGGL